MISPSGLPRHKCFISFHHARDQAWREKFTSHFRTAFDDYSVRDGDIDDSLSTERVRQIIRDDYIRDATVTIVLIGAETWKRKHVDWEIASSLRDTPANPRTGLLGIVLPSYRLPVYGLTNLPQRPPRSTEPPAAQYSPNNIPPRLWDNVASGFARIHPWPQSAYALMQWIHLAYDRRNVNPPPVSSRDSFSRNRSETDPFWVD